MVKNAEFSGYYYYMNTKKQRNFQICVSVPLIMNNMDFMLFQLLQFQRTFLLCQNN